MDPNLNPGSGVSKIFRKWGIKKVIKVLILFAMVLLRSSAIDLNKVKELRDLGFSNDQIVEMMRNPQTVIHASGRHQADEPPIKTFSDKERLYFRKLEATNKGLVIIVASKEYVSRGPGFLEFYGPNGLQDSVNLGRVNILDYSSDASAGMMVSKHVEFNNRWLNDYTISHHQSGVISRYYGEFEVPAGIHELKIQRRLHLDKDPDPRYDWIKVTETRHKKFHQVEVIPGKATVLSYMWTDNDHFGHDHVISQAHRNLVRYVEAQYGERLHAVKVQHNE